MSAGIPWASEDVVRAGRCLWEEPCFRFRGIYTHCGESYEKMAPDARAADQATVTARLQDIASRYHRVRAPLDCTVRTVCVFTCILMCQSMNQSVSQLSNQSINNQERIETVSISGDNFHTLEGKQ